MAKFYKPPTPRYYRFGAQPMRWASTMWRGYSPTEKRSAEAHELGDLNFAHSFYDNTHSDELQQSFRVLSSPRSGPIVAETGGPRYGSPEPLSPQMYPAGVGEWPLGLSTIKVIGLAAAAVAIAMVMKKK